MALKSEKLKKADYAKLLQKMRGWAPNLLPDIAKLVAHVNWLEAHLTTAELELRALKQTHMIFNEHKPYEPAPPPEVKWAGVKGLKERIQQMVADKQTDTDAWRLMLKFNSLSHQQALDMLNDEILNPACKQL